MVNYNWIITDDADGIITAKYEKSNGLIAADIKISYDEKSYSIEYVDSKNLDVNLEAKKIHRNYVRWINNLNKMIYQTYLTTEVLCNAEKRAINYCPGKMGRYDCF